MNSPHHIENPDVILIGSGIMSATLGVVLKELDPSLKIQLYEAADGLAHEASDGWHNAGTGHAGLCELSYTPDYGPMVRSRSIKRSKFLINSSNRFSSGGMPFARA